VDHIILQPIWVRITHWINVVAIVLMVPSGWQIYNASPIFSNIRFPAYITLGGWLGGALQWHFAFMWILVTNFLVYVLMLFVSGRLRDKFLPVNLKSIVEEFRALLRNKVDHKDLSRYNSMQKVAYVVAIVSLAVSILSGLAIWKSVQFPLLRTLMGGYDSSRVVHFVAMSVLVVFIFVHVVMVILVPRTLILMIRGR
jgi:thiosulfate reductase cytochrome b subunit